MSILNQARDISKNAEQANIKDSKKGVLKEL